MTTFFKPSSQTIWHPARITRQLREQRNGHRALLLWFTGLSGAGKSTLAHAVEECLFLRGFSTYVLDGDNIRHGLCADLGFSAMDRTENIRRIGETAKVLLDAGIITLTAFISPYQGDREKVRALLPYDFIEIYCHCALETCEARDVKGLYKKARAGEIKEFTGISAPYQAPVSPELIIETDRYTLAESVARVLGYLDTRQLWHALKR